MGHEDIRATLDVYGHLIERIEAKADKAPGLLASMRKNSSGESISTAAMWEIVDEIGLPQAVQSSRHGGQIDRPSGPCKFKTLPMKLELF